MLVRQRRIDMLAEQAGHVLARRRQAVVQRRGDQHLDDRLLRPTCETALNRLGVYHFDQVAELTDENAGWIETHLGIAGRIGREHWREQARELATATAGAKKAAGKQ